ncbi:MAG: putative glutamate--cysteine ligase 2 [Gemmatimonadetes bacterium]|nr:putative glutamate--cysteine ligase 2 [Gemmatimonadota bacterium]
MRPATWSARSGGERSPPRRRSLADLSGPGYISPAGADAWRRMARPDDYTVGVEEEYQLLDAATGELRSRARWVIAGDWADELHPEMQQHTVEVQTRVCRGTECLRDDLARLRFQASVAAGAEGLRIASAGTHPFAAELGHAFTDEPAYRRIRREYRHLAETQGIYGMHVHVGVPRGRDRVKAMNVARLHLPLLLALTASSPFFQGTDTGYASYRTLVWRRWPRSGPPPRMADEAEMRGLVQWLTETGSIDAPGRIYWELRPHHVYPTLELRVADATPRLEDAVAAAALARAIVAGAVEGVLREPDAPPVTVSAMLAENGWRVSRDALGATLIDLDAPEPRTIPLRDALLRLADRVGPLAAELGDGDLGGMLDGVLRRGGAAERIREAAREAGQDWARLALWIADETVLGAGMDRRAEQRAEENP